MTSERSQSKSGAQISPELMDSCPVGWELHTCRLTNSRQTQKTRSSAQPSPGTYSLGTLITCLSQGLSFPIYEIKKLDHATSSQTPNF